MSAIIRMDRIFQRFFRMAMVRGSKVFAASRTANETEISGVETLGTKCPVCFGERGR